MIKELLQRIKGLAAFFLALILLTTVCFNDVQAAEDGYVLVVSYDSPSSEFNPNNDAKHTIYKGDPNNYDNITSALKSSTQYYYNQTKNAVNEAGFTQQGEEQQRGYSTKTIQVNGSDLSGTVYVIQTSGGVKYYENGNQVSDNAFDKNYKKIYNNVSKIEIGPNDSDTKLTKVNIIYRQLPTAIAIKSEGGVSKIHSGEKLQLSITKTPEDVDDPKLNWSSDNTGIATVDNDGKVTGVAAGTATIKAVVDGSDPEISASFKVTVEAESKAYSISGKVVDDKDQPLSGAVITVNPDNRSEIKEVKTNDKGEFTISGLPNDKYEITAKKGDVSGKVNVTVSDADAKADTIMLKQESEGVHSVTGKVVDDKDQPLSDTTITVNPDNRSDKKEVKTDGNGEFTISGLPNGTYDIKAEKGDKSITREGVVVDGKDVNLTDKPIKMPSNSSHVEASGSSGELNTGGATVNGLDKLAAESTQESATYKMEIEGKTYDEVASNGGSQIREKAQRMYSNLHDIASQLKECFLDASIFKIVNGNSERITKTNNTIEMIFPFDMSGKYNPVFWRYHGSNAQAFTQENESSYSGKDGTFYVKGVGKGAEIHSFSENYSTFALTYSTEQVNLVDPDSVNTDNSATPPTASSASSGSNSTTNSSSNPLRWITGSTSDDKSSSSSSSSSDKSYKAGKGSSKATYIKNGKGTVCYDIARISNKAKTATVPSTVKIGKKKYKVTAIASYAFTGYDNLKTVIVGKNVKSIHPDAFSGAKKLKVLKIKSTKLTAKKIKNSLRNSEIEKVIILKPAHKKFKYYKKIFTRKITGAPHALDVSKGK